VCETLVDVSFLPFGDRINHYSLSVDYSAFEKCPKVLQASMKYVSHLNDL